MNVLNRITRESKKGMLLALLCLPGILLAQTPATGTDSLETEEIDIVKAYSPTLADAVKIRFMANIEKEERKEVKLDYNVPAKVLEVQYEPTPLKPVAVKREKPNRDFTDSYFKLGAGSQYSLLAEALFNDGQYEKYNYGAFYRHLSSRGAKLAHQDFSNHDATVFGGAYLDKAKVDGNISYKSRSVFYYGYDHSDTSFTKQESKQRFSTIGANIQVGNHLENKKDFDVHSNIGFYTLKDLFNSKETALEFGFGFTKTFKSKHFMTFEFVEDYSALSQNGASLNRNIVVLNPQYVFDNDTWSLLAGLSLTFEGNVTHLFPDFGMERNLLEHKIIFYNGWKRTLQKNSYQTFTNSNPYVSTKINYKNSRIEDRFVGFKGTPAPWITYNVQFSQKIYNHLPLFVNDSTDLRKFLVVYDKRTSVINLLGEVDIVVNNNLKLLVMASYFRYELDQEARAWHMPSFKMNIGAHYKIGDKILLTAEVYGIDKSYAKLPGNQEATLRGIADVNVGAEYKFNKFFTIFANANNLIGTKHSRWYNYPSYGFNALAGVKLTY